MKRKISILLLIALWASLALGSWLLPDKGLSRWERRPLAEKPELTMDRVLNGKFMKDFEEYTLDQFPLREAFRGMKSLFHYYVMGQKDNNDIYLAQGHAAKQEYPLNERSLDNAMNRFNYLYEKYMTQSNVVMAVVPDKGYYLAEESGHLRMDYEKLFSTVREKMPWATHVDLTGLLSLDDYYRTDTHWRQERLIPAAAALANALKITEPKAEDYKPSLIEEPFFGVYYGYAALPMSPDKIYVMNNDLLRHCDVYDHEKDLHAHVYDMEQTVAWDLYNIFLSGPKSLLTIENEQAATDRELIVFRDSFGSSMVPLLVHDYAKVTVVDIRYMRIDTLEKFVEFEGKDVLMLYSTLVLNQSSAIQ